VTYSIVARDPETGQLGGAVQSHSFGAVRCIWARAGVGAVATQSFADLGYGPLGLDLMQAGKTPAQALSALRAADELEAFRQVAIVDGTARTAVHTGSSCIAEAGHAAGDGYSVQANMMASEDVWPAMAKAFESSVGTLAVRLLAAMDAAQAAGGDWRGQQAAALLVVAGESSGRPWDDRLVDVRVDDSRAPLAELRRLVVLAEGYRRLLRREPELPIRDAVAAAAEAGFQEVDILWAGVIAGSADDVDEGRRYLDRLLELDSRYLEVLRRRRSLADAYGVEPLEGAP
jgi:uncharacterized Ntn-hydrolase superfamily protein